MTEYSIVYDPDTAILEVRVEGFWDHAAIARFVTEFAEARDGLRARGQVFGILGDASQFAVQAQEIMEGMTKLVDAGNQVGRSPVAVVAGSALAKMQIARTMAAQHLRVFATRGEALAWLSEQLGRA